jgi:hypothetical protein
LWRLCVERQQLQSTNIIVDPDWGREQKAILTANLILGKATIPVEIDVPIGAGAWTVGIVPPGVTVHLLSDIAELLGGNDYQAALPKQLVDMTALQIQSLLLQFDPKGPTWSGIDINLATANSWPIGGNIQVEGVGLALRVRPKSSPMVSGTVSGLFKVGTLEFQVAIPIPLSGAIQISGRTNQPLPGFGALADLVDAPFAASLPDGIARLGSLKINNMFLAYDLNAKAISSLGIEVASDGAWTLIPDYLSLDNLLFGINAQKLSGGWSIRGIASGTILVADIRVGVAVQGGMGAWNIELTEPLLLPGIGKLASLVGGHDSASALPPGFDTGIGALTVYRYEMAFGGEKNSLQNLSLSLGTSNPWKFWDPYFVLQRLDVALDVTGPTGSRVLTASIQGVLEIAGLDIVLSANKPATSTGWTFFGGLGPDQELAVGDFIAYLTEKFGVTPQRAIHKFDLFELAVTFVTDPKAFTFHAAGQFEIAGEASNLTIDFGVNPKTEGGFNLAVNGDLFVGPAHFRITFDKTPEKSALTATWDETNAPIGFSDIAKAFGFAPPSIPENLDLTLTGVGFSYDFTSGQFALEASSKNYGQIIFLSEILNGQRIFLFDFEIPLNIRLSAIPLAGERIPKSLDAGIQSLELTYSSAALATQEVSIINQGITKIAAKPLGPSTLPQGINFFGVLLLATEQEPFSLSVNSGPTREVALEVAAGGPPAASSGTGKWFNVGKSFGPFQIDRVGVQYQNSTLMFALDAGIGFGPLALSLDGLAVGSPLNHFSPVFSISGLGISYNKPPLQITGAVLRVPDAQLPSGVKFQFDGTLILKAETFSLSAIGSYAQLVSGASSLFVFAQLEAPLGGPPAFFVVGLMAGFGFNRTLAIPAQDEVEDFPLLLLAQQPVPGQQSKPQDPTQILQVLEGSAPLNGVTKAWITPQAGEYWLAAGLEFTSFELVRTKALLIVEFGNDLEIALLGLSTLQMPQPEESLETYAYVEMMIRVVIQPSQGFFAATAILSKNSYVITPDCHITGGFAFYLWFGSSPHAGEFVTTLGGYHPAFKAPSYYPEVPRLGFNWAVSDVVSVKGNAYFALTPSCIMAGGGLEVLFHDGDLQAWYIAHADFLVAWRPFFYTADIDVSIGASYRLNLLFCHKTITLSLGANLHLWGPPTGGIVHIDLTVISLSVRFGSDGAGQNQSTLLWKDFKTLLPDPSTICQITLNAGLYKTQEDSSNSSGKLWFVRAQEFRFSTQSAIPASHLQFGDQAGDLIEAPSGGINIRPMNRTEVISTHTLKIYRNTEAKPVDASKWTLASLAQNVPESLWGAPPSPFTQTPGQPAAHVIPGQVSGYTVAAPTPEPGASRGVVALRVLAEEQIKPDGQSPLSTMVASSPDYLPTFNRQTVGLIQEVMDRAVAQSRDSLFAVLSGSQLFTGSNGDLSQLAAKAAHIYSDSPMRQT